VNKPLFIAEALTLWEYDRSIARGSRQRLLYSHQFWRRKRPNVFVEAARKKLSAATMELRIPKKVALHFYCSL
jgi:hypothetical protein